MSEKDLVHVIDDDEAVRESLAFLLRTANLDVKTYESARAFLDSAKEASKGQPSGCIVTDVRMPGLSGLELLQQLRTDRIKLPVIVITGHGDIQLAVEAMKSGAVDFLEKPFDDERVLQAVHSALSVRSSAKPKAGGRSEIAERLASLSQRERQVLDGLVAGQPNKTIAHDLGISPRTVEVYRANVMTKMQAGSLSDLVRMALTVEQE
jgi:two-component system, LuxR family, response regulator FixJ